MYELYILDYIKLFQSGFDEKQSIELMYGEMLDVVYILIHGLLAYGLFMVD
jgi:hypothetical protein